MSALDFLEAFAAGLPFLAVLAICSHYVIRRAVWKRNRRLGRPTGFCPSIAAMGAAFLFMQVFHRPSLVHVVEVKREEAADEDDDGDPDTPDAHLNRQLRRIQRGEDIGLLTLKLE